MVKLNDYAHILPMINNSITIQSRSKSFAIRVIRAYTEINKRGNYDDAARVLAKQFLRSGTSIGANFLRSEV